MISPISIRISAEGFAEQVSGLLAGLIPDLLSAIIDQATFNVATGADAAAVGTQNTVFRFGIDPVLLDLKIRTALRAAGLNLDAGHDEHSVKSEVATVAPEVVVSNEPMRVPGGMNGQVVTP